MAYGRFRRARAHKMVVRSSGDFTTTSTSFVAMDPSALDIALAAQPGDTIEYGISGLWSNQAVVGEIDIAAVTSGRLLSGSTRGVGGWSGQASAYAPVTGSTLFVLAAADIASGIVTLRPYYRVYSAGTKTLFATDAAYALRLHAKNLGPADST